MRVGSGNQGAVDPTLQALLERTSRTFALTIPLLPEELVTQVGAAYLLLRIADTIEDESRWLPAVRVAVLHELADALTGSDMQVAALVERLATLAAPADMHCAELLTHLPAVLRATLPDSSAGKCILQHTRRTILGMAETVARVDHDGHLQLVDLADLTRYCYVVAGIVGELLTELFILHDARLIGSADRLRGAAVAFGEGLQLVNILKDRERDALEQRCYLPPAVSLTEVVARADADLVHGRDYVMTLIAAGAIRGVVAFAALPILLAEEALVMVRRHGAGTKVPRARVGQIIANLHASLARDELPPLVDACQ
jgi:farnesyl-diphosphate farnesyltransferase